MASNVTIRIAADRVDIPLLNVEDKNQRLFTPGEVVTNQQGFMRGHGTYMEDEHIKSSVAGVMVQVNKLITVKALKGRYVGEVGDVVVARVTEVQEKRWKVDTNSRLDSVLLLSSVNLPGGELRRRGAEDEKQMRKYLQEGDLISAEIQNVHSDGVLSLHTRSLKYGKLSQGILVKVFPALIRRRKTHFHNLPCGASIILGNNGFIWIAPILNTEGEDAGHSGGFTQNLEDVVPKEDRETIARLKNCILGLAHCKMMLFDTSIMFAYEESMKYDVLELLHPEVIADVAFLTQHRLHVLNQ
ncbi:exosome complex component RRP4 isoform X2 [Anopheles bellator]|uniref:exosome complex component RRP4 isoform X2 n=1 Tax=Anopheles bellator TaxID=139047 RepID=UPI0026495A0D|nr:exosome complex component RRP4 isoform X2 [Anopheles bellator]